MKFFLKQEVKQGFYKRALYISLSFFVLSIVMLQSEFFRDTEDFLLACYNQISSSEAGHDSDTNFDGEKEFKQRNIINKKRNNSQVVIVKKDIQSTSLFKKLHKNADRSIYADLIGFLGKDKQIKHEKNKNTRSIKFFTMEIGLFKNIKDLPIITSFYNWKYSEVKAGSKLDFQNNYDSQAELISGSQKVKNWFSESNAKGIGSFIKIKEELWPPKGQNVFKKFSAGSYFEVDPLLYQEEAYKLRNIQFLVLPTLFEDWQNEEFKKTLTEFCEAVKNNKKYVVNEKFKNKFKLLWQWTNFIVNASMLELKPVFEFPSYKGKYDSEKGFLDDVTLMRFSLSFSTEIKKDYVIPAASVIGFDFILDFDKNYDEKMNSMDMKLIEALENSKSNIVLAAYTKLDIEREYFYNDNDKEKALTIKKGNITELREYNSLYSKKEILVKPAQKFLMNKNSTEKLTNISKAAINITKGNKGYVSSIPLYVTYGGDNNLEHIMPAFSLKIAMLVLDERAKNKNIKNDKTYTQAMYDELERIRKLKEENINNKSYRGEDYVKINDLEIPVDEEGKMYINFIASTGDEMLIDNDLDKQVNRKLKLPSYSLYECVGSEALKITDSLSENELKEIAKDSRLDYNNIFGRVLGKDSWLFDRIGVNRTGLGSVVLFGPFELTDMDFYPTPLTVKTGLRGMRQDTMMGVEIHANAIINILDKLYLKPHKMINFLFIVTLFSACLILAFILELVTPVVGLFIMCGMVYYALYSGYVSYTIARQIIYVSPFLFAFPLIWGCSTLLNYIQQSIQTQTTKAMFSRFVSADVVKYILDNPDSVKPGGEKAELTVFFSDVAGFTTISEKLSPEELVVLLNEYLGAMTDIVFKYGGTLDKFIGDAVMAFWNYPRKQEDHCLRACLCALEMQRKIDELQVDWAKRGLPKVAARCGINSAEVVVGYMGSIKAQMNFTCMGDGVNLASRLEGANKEYGTKMMISESVYLKVKDKITCRFLDFLAVKGKKEPVKVYELVSEKGSEPENWSELSEKYDEAMNLHLGREWDKAIGLFDEILEKFPNDGPSITYKARCEEYKNHPPPEDWDGRYILTHK